MATRDLPIEEEVGEVVAVDEIREDRDDVVLACGAKGTTRGSKQKCELFIFKVMWLPPAPSMAIIGNVPAPPNPRACVGSGTRQRNEVERKPL